MVGVDQTSSVQSGEIEETVPRGQDENCERQDLTAAEYQARLVEIAELITRVRHEINNPLTGVLGQAQLLQREDLSERARKRAQTIEELAIRIRDVVTQLRQVQFK